METSYTSEGWSSLGVPSIIIKALLEQNFHTPTEIQTLSIPSAILGKRDILGAAETGSGKTLAFGIPVLNGIMELKKKCGVTIDSPSGIFKEISKCQAISNENNNDNDLDNFNSDIANNIFNTSDINNSLLQVPSYAQSRKEKMSNRKSPLYALILTPTRELAIQIKNHLVLASKYTDIKIAVVVGGMAAVKQERLLNQGPEIVIATPGRLWELIDEGNLHLSQIDSIRYLVIDETDRMMEKGHFQELHNIIARINSKQSKILERQTFVFSATLTLVHDVPDYLQKKRAPNSKSKIFKLTPGQKLQKIIQLLKVKNPKIVDVTSCTGTTGNLTECRIACTIDYKDYYLYYFLQQHPGRTLVFCNSIGCVKRLVTLFGILNCKPSALHASMPQQQRLRSLERFQLDDHGLLIATDVAARGLDIPNIEHVIHYQVPRTSESYIHRSGRTARGQKEGITVLMMEPSERQFYSRLCRTLNRTEDLPTFPVVDRLLVNVKERVNVAREIDKIELVYRRENSQRGWLQKAAKEMDILLDDKEYNNSLDDKDKANFKKTLKLKRNQLNCLLKRPLFPNNYSGKYINKEVDVSLRQNSQKAIDVMKKALIEGSHSSLKKKSKLIALNKDNVASKRNLDWNKMEEMKKPRVY